MCPRPRGTIRSRPSFIPRITPWMLMSTIRRAVRSSSSMNLPICMIPALLISTSTGPSWDSASSRNRANDSRSVTSRLSATAVGPSSLAVARAASRSRSPIATRIPTRGSAWAVARPIPRAAPVIAAV